MKFVIAVQTYFMGLVLMCVRVWGGGGARRGRESSMLSYNPKQILQLLNALFINWQNFASIKLDVISPYIWNRLLCTCNYLYFWVRGVSICVYVSFCFILCMLLNSITCLKEIRSRNLIMAKMYRLDLLTAY